ncbi:MAG: DUF4349 domain-containing protein [Nitriliruptoraceae bacterium]
MNTQHRARTRRRSVIVASALFTLLALLVSACGGEDAGDFDGAEMSTSDSAGAMPAPMEAEERALADDGGGSDPIPPIEPGAPTGRHVVRSADITIRVDEPDRATDTVIAIAERAGGYAATIDVSNDDVGLSYSWLTLRVPTDRLEDVVDEIADVGDEVPHSRIDEYDVTMEVVDIDARLSNLRAFEDELLQLLTEVRESEPDAEALLAVFSRIREVRAEIDQLEARQTALEDQIDYATIHVGIEQHRAAAEIAWDPGSTLRDAFAATVRLLTVVVDGVIWTVVTVLPIAVAVLALPALVGVVVWRRRRRATPGDAN